MNLKEQMGVLISAANIRRDQWKALVDNRDSIQCTNSFLETWTPDETIRELWEVWDGMEEDPDDTEAKDMSRIITTAINYVQAIEIEGREVCVYSAGDMPSCPHCGARAEIVLEIDDKTQRLDCPDCNYQYVGEWVEDITTAITLIVLDEYQNIRLINGMICGTKRMMFTVGVFYDLDDAGYHGLFCFDTEQNAKLFLQSWDGKTPPTIGEDGCKAIK